MFGGLSPGLGCRSIILKFWDQYNKSQAHILIPWSKGFVPSLNMSINCGISDPRLANIWQEERSSSMWNQKQTWYFNTKMQLYKQIIRLGKVFNPIICGVKICYLSAGGPSGPPLCFQCRGALRTFLFYTVGDGYINNLNLKNIPPIIKILYMRVKNSFHLRVGK